MPRRPRFAVTGWPLHVVQRGNDRGACFFADADYRVYLKALCEAVTHYGVAVHAYVLMTNHVHLLATPFEVGAISRAMQSVGARYVAYVNGKYRRTGTLWEGRYKACLVEDDRHVLAACRYIDLNPVRAGIVSDPAVYRFSSYAGLAGLRDDALLVPHGALDILPDAPGPGYARWCGESVREDETNALRRATASELVYGGDVFKRRIEAVANRPTTPKLRGRAAARWGSEP